MREVTIGRNDAGQRLDRFLGKYMRLAPKSFFYRMMRKKNITLNGKRCEGAEMLAEGDTVKLFLSDETIDKFSRNPLSAGSDGGGAPRVPIIYEDDDIILFNKPAGMLSQKAKEDDFSLVEYLIGYLTETGAVTEEELRSFRPSVCNRLDRNTSGIVAAGKSLAGLQFLSAAFRDRSVRKYYRCIVCGELEEPLTLDGWLIKDEAENTVRVYTAAAPPGAARIVTRFETLASNGACTLLEIELITGRTHQIRAHLASIGHPVAGDRKYGKAEYAGDRKNGETEYAGGRRQHEKETRKKSTWCDPIAEKYRLRSQLLHAYRLEFPQIEGKFAYLSGRAFEAALPSDFVKTAAGERLLRTAVQNDAVPNESRIKKGRLK